MLNVREIQMQETAEGSGEFVIAEPRAALPEEALARLVENHRAFLAFLERRTRNRAVAEDVLQDAFSRAMTTSAGVRDAEAATAWFYRLLRNALVDHHRRAATREKMHATAAGELEVSTPSDRELHEAICQCIAGLASAMRPELEAAVRRVDIDGASIATYAAEAGITPNNARVRLFRARSTLRELVRAACGACAKEGCGDCSCATHRCSHREVRAEMYRSPPLPMSARGSARE